MATTKRSSKKPSTAAAGAKGGDAAGKHKGSKNDKKEEEEQPLPFMARMASIILTSFVAEKIWRHRTIVTEGWYSDKQSATEQAMITAFEYIVAMGMLFFMGILISTVTVTAQRKLGL